jgi:hypothetical protein
MVGDRPALHPLDVGSGGTKQRQSSRLARFLD